MNVAFKIVSKRIGYLEEITHGTFFKSGRYWAERITIMGLILLSMTMFFVMLFATAQAIRNEARDDRSGLTRDRLIK
jgi:uncharacterized membrane protein